MSEEMDDIDAQHDMFCGWSFSKDCGYCNDYLETLAKPENRDELRKVVIDAKKERDELIKSKDFIRLKAIVRLIRNYHRILLDPDIKDNAEITEPMKEAIKSIIYYGDRNYEEDCEILKALNEVDPSFNLAKEVFKNWQKG